MPGPAAVAGGGAAASRRSDTTSTRAWAASGPAWAVTVPVPVPTAMSVVPRLAETGADERGDTLVMDTVQYWFPVPGQAACLFVSASTPNLATADELVQDFDRIASSVELLVD